MFDIKSIESGEKKHENIENNYYQKNSSYASISSVITSPISTSSLTSSLSISSSLSSLDNSAFCIVSTTTINNSHNNKIMLFRRRRIFQRQACLLSVMAAFSLGLALGVFIPIIGMSAAFTSSDFVLDRNNKTIINHQNTISVSTSVITDQQQSQQEQNPSAEPKHPPSNFPTIYEIRTNSDNHQNNHHSPSSSDQTVSDKYSVSFVKDDKELPSANVYRNSLHTRQQDKNSKNNNVRLNVNNNYNENIKNEYRVQRPSSDTGTGSYRQNYEKDILEQQQKEDRIEVEFIPIESKISSKMQSYLQEVIKDGIYWGDLVERSLPRGYSNQDAEHWNDYVRNAVITHLEVGCGRMQNRMVIFSDGTRACARYRQNTDQIQGELFSFFLGQLLNLTNLAPSAASVIDLETEAWSNAIQDITLAQWKSFRPVVLTRWLPNLEPAGIPKPFQPLERHLNKFDVWNITLGIDHESKTQQHQKGLLERLGAALNDDQSKTSADAFNVDSADGITSVSSNDNNIKISGINNNDGDASAAVTVPLSDTDIIDNDEEDNDNDFGDHNHYYHLNKQQNNNNYTSKNKYDKDRLMINSTILYRLIELAQWSDLIIFDYLIANLDRVVNNLYNYQWNADIMAAPAHNLAKQTNSQLLLFLDNESGLLHGYRLLKKYEAYHGLLLDNLCVFRRNTIKALQSLKDYGVGHQLQQLFEKLTSHQIRDVLPSLPDKSIKILIDRIDRILDQVHKCRDLFSYR